MSGRCLRSNKSSNNGEQTTECMVNLSVQQFKHGDIIWSKINGGSWWPVQVINEKCVAFKPKKRKNGQILVRLYGTFEHIYVEPVNCVSKIEKIFGQENSSNKEVFQKALEEELAHMNSGGQSGTGVFETKENEKEKDETPSGKGQRKEKLKRTVIADNSTLVDSSDNPKAAKQVKASGDGILKRRTRSETFKARNEGKSRIEVSNETQNVNSGTSTISSLDKKDSKEKLTSTIHSNAQIEFSDAKGIKKLVAKIVKEVAAEKARNEALKAIDDTQDRIDAGKPNGAEKVSNGGTLGKPDFDSGNIEKTKDKAKVVVSREQMDSPGTPTQTKCNIQEENGGLRPRCERVMRSLGLIPPLGSPFRRDGLIKSP